MQLDLYFVPIQLSSISKWAYFLVDITCAMLKLGASAAPQTGARHMTFKKACPLRATRKSHNVTKYKSNCMTLTL